MSNNLTRPLESAPLPYYLMKYTTPQVLEIVGISRRTLQSWIADGKIKKPGGQGVGRLWDISEVKVLLDLKQNSARGRKRGQLSDGKGG